MKILAHTLVLLLGGLAAAGSAQTNLVTNGDFETQSINTLGNGTYHCFRNATFHGWTQSTSDGSFGSCFHRGGRDGFPAAYSGGVFMYVNDSGDINESIGQSLNVVGGTRYRLDFAVGGYAGLVAPLEVSFGAFKTTVPWRNADEGWVTHSFTYTPNSTGAAWLSFTSREFESAITLDAVSVVAIPEPGTYALMALGLGCVGVVARRGKQLG